MQAVSIGTLKLKDINGDTRSITIYDDFRKFPDYIEGEDNYIAIYHKSEKVGYLFSSREVYTNTEGEPTKCIFAEFIDKKGHKQYLYEYQFELSEYPITSISRTSAAITDIDEVLIDEEDFEDLPYGATLYVTGSRGANGNSGGNGTAGTNPTWKYVSGQYSFTSGGTNGTVGTGGDGGRNGYYSTAKITLERENLITNELTEDHVTITSGHGYGAGGGGGGAGGERGYAIMDNYTSPPRITKDFKSGGPGGSGGIANSLPNEIIFNIPSRTKLTIDSMQIYTTGTGSKGNDGAINYGGSGGNSTDGYPGGGYNGRIGGTGASSYTNGQYSVNFDNKSTELFFYQNTTTNQASLLNNTVSGIGGIQLNGLEYVPYPR